MLGLGLGKQMAKNVDNDIDSRVLIIGILCGCIV